VYEKSKAAIEVHSQCQNVKQLTNGDNKHWV
jgi:hypothetical protein